MKNKIAFICIMVFVLSIKLHSADPGDYYNNSVFLSHNYVKYASYISYVNTLCDHMRNDYACPIFFVNSGFFVPAGSVNNPSVELAKVKDFLNAIKNYEDNHQCRFTLIAWLSGDKNGLDLSSSVLRGNIADECLKFVSLDSQYLSGASRAFDGVLIDIEPTGNDDLVYFNNYKLLISNIKNKLINAGLSEKKTGVAAHKYALSGSWHWGPSHYYEMAFIADWLLAMCYNSGSTDTAEYKYWIKNQTINILQAVSGKYWADSSHPPPGLDKRVFIGLPAYPAGTYHIRDVETIRYSAEGILEGLQDLEDDLSDNSENYFEGASLYLHSDGSGTDEYSAYDRDWLWWKKYWLGDITIPPYKIYGYVKDNKGQAVSGARVSISGDLSNTYITNENGFYEFKELLEGYSFFVDVLKEGYVFKQSSTAVNNINVDTECNFNQINYYAVSGKLLNEYGIPIANSIVTISGSHINETCLTDINGNYVFNEIYEKADFNIAFISELYTATPKSINILNLDKNLFEQNFTGVSKVQEGSLEASNPIELYKYSISGVIKDKNKIPIENAVVSFVSVDTSSSVLSDSNGVYEFKYINNSVDYTITSSKESYIFIPSEIYISKVNKNYEYQNFIGIEKKDVLKKTENFVRIFPNPYHPFKYTCGITFTNLKSNGKVKIYTIEGVFINELAENQGNVVWHADNFNERVVASGVYLCSVESNKGNIIKKVVIYK